jgi:hypothetical protein
MAVTHDIRPLTGSRVLSRLCAIAPAGLVHIGAAVLIVKDGEVVHARGYGLRDVEGGLGVLIRSTSRMIALTFHDVGVDRNPYKSDAHIDQAQAALKTGMDVPAYLKH